MVYSLVLCMIEFGSVYSQLVEGWLFDVYPLGDKMVFWIKQENGGKIRLEEIGVIQFMFLQMTNQS